MGELFYIAVIIGIIVGIYALLHIRGPIGTFLRMIWNAAVTIMSIIPMMSWMEMFIVKNDVDSDEN